MTSTLNDPILPDVQHLNKAEVYDPVLLEIVNTGDVCRKNTSVEVVPEDQPLLCYGTFIFVMDSFIFVETAQHLRKTIIDFEFLTSNWL